MNSKERKNVVFTILGKTLLYIVAVALIFALLLWAWEKHDWLPFVKSIIRGVVIPILLGGLSVYLLRREFGVLKDKWKPFVLFVLFLTGTMVFVNVGIIVQETCAKVMTVGSITTLSNEEIKKADYLQIESVEPDTSASNYLFEDALIPRRRGSSKVNFLLYQVCPLKDKKGVFLCTRTKETHPLRMSSRKRIQQYQTDFINREKGSIKNVALSAHFFKVVHQSDRYEPYQAVATTSTTRHGAISPEQLVLLEIRQPDTIKRWEDNALYILCSLLVGFAVLAITLMGTGVLNEEFRGK